MSKQRFEIYFFEAENFDFVETPPPAFRSNAIATLQNLCCNIA